MTRQKLAMLVAAVLLAANIIVPLLFGDVYPFTSAPMFRDAPVQCVSYYVFVDGHEQPTGDWLLNRIYDGNPVGYGVGVRPPPVLEQEYGLIHTETAVREHILRQLELPQHKSIPRVEVVQEVLGGVGQRVGVIETNRWIFDRSVDGSPLTPSSLPTF